MFNPEQYLIDLKGKKYLQVMYRLVWFREAHPDWSIETSMVDHDKQTQTATFYAVLRNEEGRVIQTAYGSECIKDFKDYIEKAETKAVGRCLAMAGFGTQFTGLELDEGQRIVDSPVPTTTISPKNLKTVKVTLERLGIPEEELAAYYGKEKLAALTESDYADFAQNGQQIINDWRQVNAGATA